MVWFCSTMKLIICVLVVTSLVGICVAQTDYCDQALCRKQGPHIACKGLTKLADACGTNAQEVALGSDLQQYIVSMHNEGRNRVALGQQNYTASDFFPTASRMATLVWDPELASIAAANARRCVYGHDKCRSTPSYPNAGQNIASQSYQGTSYKIRDLVKGFVNDWYSEFKDANAAIMGAYPKGYSGPAIGHFTQMVSDRSTGMGCAMVNYEDADKWTNQYMVCNYAITQITNQPVYVAGKACSGCTTGCNEQYPGLCKVGEPIVPKP